VIAKQLTHTPAPARDPGRHGRWAITHSLGRHLAKARVRRAAVVDRADQPHAGLQVWERAGQSARATRQARQALATRPVEPLNGGRVEDALTRGRRACLLGLVGPAVHDAALDLDNAVVVVAFDDLYDQPPSPDTQRLAAAPAGGDVVAACLAGGAHVGAQPIGTDEETPRPCAAAYAQHQASEQGQVALGPHFASEPQPRGDHDRHGHPDDSTLALDPQFIRLHLSEPPRRLDQVRVHGVAVRSSKPKAATMAWRGQPWASSVTTSVTVAAGVRRR
jgi:hypothetical protein